MLTLIFGWTFILAVFALVGGGLYLVWTSEVDIRIPSRDEQVLMVEIPKGPRGLDGEQLGPGRVKRWLRGLWRRG